MKLTFGKYRNQQLSKVYEDNNYKNWLLSQQFFKDQYSDEYQYLLNYKPQINFNDLPCDIKSLIFGINYNAEKEAHETELAEEKSRGIVRTGKNNKGRKQIIKRKCPYSLTGRISESVKYLNCENCGGYLSYNGGGCYNQQTYPCCPGCYEKFRRETRKRKEQQKQLLNNFCLFSDSEDEE